MKRFLLLFLLVFSSCKEDELTKHLESGLVDYYRTRPVGEKIIDSIRLEKFAIFNTGKDSFSLVLKLNDNVKKEEIDKYNVAIEVILNDENILLRDDEVDHNKKAFNFKAELKTVNNHKYLINNITTKIKRFESLDIWVFFLENNVYISAGSSRIKIKNLGL